MCEYFNHTTDGRGKDDTIYFCTNPDHSKLNIPNVFIDMKYYPVLVTSTYFQNDVNIPNWCKLNSAKSKTEEQVIFASKVKLDIMNHFQTVKKTADLHYLHGLENAVDIVEKTLRKL